MGEEIVECDAATWRAIRRQLHFGANDPLWLADQVGAIDDLLRRGGTRLMRSGWDADILEGIAVAIAADTWLRAQQVRA